MIVTRGPWLLLTVALSGGLAVEARQRANVDWSPSMASSHGPTSAPQAAANQAGLVQQYCVGCHNDRTLAGTLSLQHVDTADVSRASETWEKVVKRLRNDSMPPAGRPRPDARTRDAFVVAIETALDRAAAANPDPGRSAALHRLNRVEYQNAVRDLLGVEMEIAALLPPDGQNFGFDNNGHALGVSPLLLDRYLSVSRRVSRAAIGSQTPPPVADIYHAPSDLNQDDRLDGFPYGTRGGLRVRHVFPVDGDYDFRIRLARNYNFLVVDVFEPHDIEILIDGERAERITVEPLEAPATAGAADERGLGAPQPDDHFQFRIPVTAGPHDVAVTFIRRPPAQLVEDRLPFLRGDPKENALHGLPWLGELSITGPFGATRTRETPSRRQILTCRPATAAEEAPCARRVLTTLARRAYRRPLTADDVTGLMAAFEEGRQQGRGFESGIELALQRMLMSPSFLFRLVAESGPAGNRAYPIGDIALASRLSFFLWSTIPDEELLTLAEQGRLSNPVILEQQVRRMLSSPRAAALAGNFAGQWLELRKLDEAAPDQRTFPNFDRSLRDAMRRETELFFASVLQGDRPLAELLTADYTFLNERLARHYGVRGVYGDRFRRVALSGSAERRGLLGHASVLTVTSYPNRTSPVLRGVWILDNLLGMPPPPPPPDVPDLEETNAAGRPLSMRERMAQHRANPTCASCHAVMDPLGLSLEHFDATGSWRRVSESGEPIDASGQLPSGATFTGGDGLRGVLLERLDVFYRTFTEKLLTYALGRAVTHADAPAVRAILRDAGRDGYRAQALVTAVVKSLPFQMRRAAADAATAGVQR